MLTESIFVKPASDVSNVGEFNGKKLSFSEDATDHLRRVLTSQYSHAEIAVVRELLSNAVDATVKAGSKRPIEVELPGYPENSEGAGNLFLRIKDYGTGMSYEEIDNVYSSYGSSDKRKDNMSNGSYGLGGKSPLAICDRYDVVSVKDGQKIEFHMGQINENDKSGAFSIVYDNISSTDEPNGVTVTVPYPHVISDTGALNVVLAGVDNLIVNGEPYKNTLYNEEIFTPVMGMLGKPVMFYTNGVDFNMKSTLLNIVLGSVIYPLDLNKIQYQIRFQHFPTNEDEDAAKIALYTKVQPFLDQLKRLNDYNNHFSCYFVLPLGSIIPIPSREDLFYDKETIDTLVYHLVETSTIFSDFIKVELENKTSYKDAYEHISKWSPILNADYDNDECGDDTRNIFWHGNKFMPEFKARDYESKAYLIDIGYNRGRKRYTSHIINLARGFSFDFHTLDPAKSLVVELPEDNERANVLVERINRRASALRSYEGTTSNLTSIYFLPKEAYDNPWWNFIPAYSKEFRTAEELYGFILKQAREKRKSMGATEKVLPYKLVTFDTAPGFNQYSHTVETINVEDERLKKPLLYTLATKSSNFVARSNKAFWKAFDSTLGLENYTILTKSPSQKTELLLKRFPDIEDLNDKVVSTWVGLAEKETYETPQLTWSVFRDAYDKESTSSNTSYMLSTVASKYVRYKNNTSYSFPEVPVLEEIHNLFTGRGSEQVSEMPLIFTYLVSFFSSHPGFRELKEKVRTVKRTENDLVSLTVRLEKTMPFTLSLITSIDYDTISREQEEILKGLVKEETKLFNAYRPELSE